MRITTRHALCLGIAIAIGPAAFAQLPYTDADHAALVEHLLDRRTRDVASLLEDWRAASGAAKTALEVELTDLAVERREYLEEVIQLDTAAAVRLFLPDADRADLESIAPGTTMQDRTITGALEVWVLDGVEDGTSRTCYVLEEADGTRTALHSADGNAGSPSSGPGLTVTGPAIGNRLVFNGELENVGCATPKVGDMDLLLVRLNFDETGQPEPKPPLPSSITGTLLESVFNGSGGNTNVREYFLEASYDQLTFDSEAFPAGTAPPLDMGIPFAFAEDPVNNPILAPSIAAIEAAGRSLDGLDGIVLFVNWTPLFGQSNYVNQATIGRIEVNTATGPKCLAVSYMGSRWANVELNVHELGHTLQLQHSNFYKSSVIGTPLNEEKNLNYRDPLSSMGFNTGNNGHFNAQHKETDLGWFAPSNFETIDTTTLPQIRMLEPISLNTTALQGIKIPRGDGSYLWMEFRYLLSGARYDTENVLGDTNAWSTSENGGAQLYIRSPKYGQTLLFDPNGTNVADSALKASTQDSFVDPCSGVEVSAVEITTPQGGNPQLEVQIESGSSPCPMLPPDVTLDYPQDGDVLWETVTLSATATDDEGVASVVFFAGGEPIGAGTRVGESNVFEFDWDTTQVRNYWYTISAVATDEPTPNCCALKTQSEGAIINVVNGPTGPLVVYLADPPTGVGVTVPFTAAATASDPDGVDEVEFWFDPDFTDPCGAGEQHDGAHPASCGYHDWFPAYSRWFSDLDGGRGAFLVATSDSAPYSEQVDSLPPGFYRVWSVAYDNVGEGASTNPVLVEVTSSTPFTADIPIAADSPVPAGGTQLLSAAVGSEPNEVAYVDFFVGEALIGRDDTAPYEVTWNVPSGVGVSYLVRARAKGLGGRTAQDSVTVISQ